MYGPLLKVPNLQIRLDSLQQLT